MTARDTATVKAAKRANTEYLAAFRQWRETEKESRGTSEMAADFRIAVPILRRVAYAAWERLIQASASLSPAERAAWAWALTEDEYSIARMHEVAA